jgi:hypothetical protein
MYESMDVQIKNNQETHQNSRLQEGDVKQVPY